jgi:hypothetical protein
VYNSGLPQYEFILGKLKDPISFKLGLYESVYSYISDNFVFKKS